MELVVSAFSNCIFSYCNRCFLTVVCLELNESFTNNHKCLYHFASYILSVRLVDATVNLTSYEEGKL